MEAPLLPPLLEGADLVGALSSRTVMLRSPREWPGDCEGKKGTRWSDRVREDGRGAIARVKTPSRRLSRKTAIIAHDGWCAGRRAARAFGGNLRAIARSRQ